MTSKIKGKSASSIFIDDPIRRTGRLFPEETVAFAVAAKVAKDGVDETLEGIQGQTDSMGFPDGLVFQKLHKMGYQRVYIRDDGWTLAVPRKFRSTAEEMWRGRWVGILHIVYFGGGYRGILEVIPENGPRYKAGRIDADGSLLPMKSLGDLNEDDEPQPSPEPTTVDDLRNWMKGGCKVD